MKTIILDNGHGKETPGKRSPVYDGKQLFEYEYNRDIVRRIMSKANFPCIQLVPEENDVSLQERVARANRLYDRLGGQCILVSIHANAGGGTGFEVWTSEGKTEADRIAQKWAEFALKTFPDIKVRSERNDGNYVKEKNFYILLHTKAPAILTENLFMDNRADFDRMTNEKFREGLAEMYIKFFNSLNL